MKTNIKILLFSLLLMPINGITNLGGIAPLVANIAQAQDKVLTVAINHYPPWVIAEERPFSGIDIDIIKTLSAELSLETKFKKCPWKRCLAMMENGKVDMMTGLFRTPEREAFMAFIEPAYFEDPPKVFYVPKGGSIKIDSYDDLKSLKIGIVRETKYFDQFDADASLKKHEVSREEQLVLMLAKGRIDTFVSTASQADYTIAKEGFRGKFAKASFRPGEGDVSYLALSKKSPFLKDKAKFDQAVKRAVDSGAYIQLAEDFYHKISINQ